MNGKKKVACICRVYIFVCNILWEFLRAAPLRITLFPESSQVTEGERLTLVCTISSGDTPLELRWTVMPSSWRTTISSSSVLTSSTFASRAGGRNSGVVRMIGSAGSEIGENERNGAFSVVNTDPYTSLLKIDKVTESHAGQYFCDASSAAGRIFRSHTLTVFGTRGVRLLCLIISFIEQPKICANFLYFFFQCIFFDKTMFV